MRPNLKRNTDDNYNKFLVLPKDFAPKLKRSWEGKGTKPKKRISFNMNVEEYNNTPNLQSVRVINVLNYDCKSQTQSSGQHTKRNQKEQKNDKKSSVANKSVLSHDSNTKKERKSKASAVKAQFLNDVSRKHYKNQEYEEEFQRADCRSIKSNKLSNSSNGRGTTDNAIKFSKLRSELQYEKNTLSKQRKSSAKDNNTIKTILSDQVKNGNNNNNTANNNNNNTFNLGNSYYMVKHYYSTVNNNNNNNQNSNTLNNLRIQNCKTFVSNKSLDYTDLVKDNITSNTNTYSSKERKLFKVQDGFRKDQSKSYNNSLLNTMQKNKNNTSENKANNNGRKETKGSSKPKEIKGYKSDINKEEFTANPNNENKSQNKDSSSNSQNTKSKVRSKSKSKSKSKSNESLKSEDRIEEEKTANNNINSKGSSKKDSDNDTIVYASKIKGSPMMFQTKVKHSDNQTNSIKKTKSLNTSSSNTSKKQHQSQSQSISNKDSSRSSNSQSFQKKFHISMTPRAFNKRSNKDIREGFGSSTESIESQESRVNPALTLNQKRRQTYLNYRSSINIQNNSKRQSIFEFKYFQKALAESYHNSDYQNFTKAFKIIEISLGILAIINVICSILDAQIYIIRKDRLANDYANMFVFLERIDLESLSGFEIFLRFVNVFISIIMIVLIYLRYHLHINLKVIDQQLSQFDNLYTSGEYKYFLFEVALSGICYPPYVRTIITGEVNKYNFIILVNAIISMITIAKVYHVVRMYKYFSKYKNLQAVSICNKHGVKADLVFALKAEIKNRPFIALSIVFSFFILLSTFCVRTFENIVFISMDYYIDNNLKIPDYNRTLLVDLKANLTIELQQELREENLLSSSNSTINNKMRNLKFLQQMEEDFKNCHNNCSDSDLGQGYISFISKHLLQTNNNSSKSASMSSSATGSQDTSNRGSASLNSNYTIYMNKSNDINDTITKILKITQLIDYDNKDKTPIINKYSISQIISKGTQDLQYILNSMWFTIQSVTTVAFGDAFPKTHFGRAVSAISCIFGIFLVSLITASFSAYTEFTSEERKAYIIIKQLQQENNLKIKAWLVVKWILEINKMKHVKKRQQIDPINSNLFLTEKFNKVNSALKKYNSSIKPDKGAKNERSESKALKSSGKEIQIKSKQSSLKENEKKSKIANLAKQFVLFTQLKRDLSNFKNETKLTNKVVPIDEMFSKMRKKLSVDLYNLEFNVNQLKTLEDSFSELKQNDLSYSSKIDNIFDLQNKILDYLIEHNNKSFKENLQQRKNLLITKQRSINSDTKSIVISNDNSLRKEQKIEHIHAEGLEDEKLNSRAKNSGKSFKSVRIIEEGALVSDLALAEGSNKKFESQKPSKPSSAERKSDLDYSNYIKLKPKAKIPAKLVKGTKDACGYNTASNKNMISNKIKLIQNTYHFPKSVAQSKVFLSESKKTTDSLVIPHKGVTPDNKEKSSFIFTLFGLDVFKADFPKNNKIKSSNNNHIQNRLRENEKENEELAKEKDTNNSSFFRTDQCETDHYNNIKLLSEQNVKINSGFNHPEVGLLSTKVLSTGLHLKKSKDDDAKHQSNKRMKEAMNLSRHSKGLNERRVRASLLSNCLDTLKKQNPKFNFGNISDKQKLREFENLIMKKDNEESLLYYYIRDRSHSPQQRKSRLSIKSEIMKLITDLDDANQTNEDRMKKNSDIFSLSKNITTNSENNTLNINNNTLNNSNLLNSILSKKQRNLIGNNLNLNNNNFDSNPECNTLPDNHDHNDNIIINQQNTIINLNISLKKKLRDLRRSSSQKSLNSSHLKSLYSFSSLTNAFKEFQKKLANLNNNLNSPENVIKENDDLIESSEFNSPKLVSLNPNNIKVESDIQNKPFQQQQKTSIVSNNAGNTTTNITNNNNSNSNNNNINNSNVNGNNKNKKYNLNVNLNLKVNNITKNYYSNDKDQWNSMKKNSKDSNGIQIPLNQENTNEKINNINNPLSLNVSESNSEEEKVKIKSKMETKTGIKISNKFTLNPNENKPQKNEPGSQGNSKSDIFDKLDEIVRQSAVNILKKNEKKLGSNNSSEATKKANNSNNSNKNSIQDHPPK